METKSTSSLSILLIAAQFCIYFNSNTQAQAQVVSDTVYEKTFSQKFAAIEIENADAQRLKRGTATVFAFPPRAIR